MKYYVDLTRDYDLFPCGRLLPLTTLGYVIHAKGDAHSAQHWICLMLTASLWRYRNEILC